MSADEFFNRWAKKNQEAREQREQEPPPPEPDPYEGRLPTLDDVAALPADAGIAPFMKKGVDETVRRSALKKLFSDPHFNIMDGLDIYIDDYTRPDPIPPEMLAMLDHAKSVLDPEGLKDKLVMAMQGESDERDSRLADNAPAGAAGDEPADAGEEQALEAGTDEHSQDVNPQAVQDGPASPPAATEEGRDTGPAEPTQNPSA